MSSIFQSRWFAGVSPGCNEALSFKGGGKHERAGKLSAASTQIVLIMDSLLDSRGMPRIDQYGHEVLRFSSNHPKPWSFLERGIHQYFLGHTACWHMRTCLRPHDIPWLLTGNGRNITKLFQGGFVVANPRHNERQEPPTARQQTKVDQSDQWPKGHSRNHCLIGVGFPRCSHDNRDETK